MGIEYISDAWKAYKKNFGIILLSVLIVGIIFLVAFSPFLIPAFKGLMMNGKELFAANSINITESFLKNEAGYNALMFNFFVSMLIAFSGILFAGVVTFPFVVGQIALFKECLKKEGKLNTMFVTAKDMFWSAIGLKILLFLIVISAMAMLSIFLVLFSFLAVYSTSATYALSFLAIVSFLLFMLFFRLAGQSMAVNKTNAMEAISESFETVKSNFLEFFSLILLFFFSAIILQQLSTLQYIGFLFSLAILFFINPLANLAYTSFFIKKSKKRKQKK